MPSPAVPPRLIWAVDSLGVASTDQVLEIGCGHGVAAQLVARQVPKGHITAIDRSERAVQRAAGLGSALITAGRMSVHRASLAEFGRDDDQTARYDVVFAVNVNLFWVDPNGPEAAVVRQVLRPSGSCVLFYDVPDVSMAARASRLAAGALRGLGFVTEFVRGPAPTFVGVRATIDAQVEASVDG
ncbi:MAG: class I SAM-dependent methyltransferase [Solirubrobacteraceae bacterium]|nr:class I SAM-dependent methyltransferase [Solirubrobacteraceae bacterium]